MGRLPFCSRTPYVRLRTDLAGHSNYSVMLTVHASTVRPSVMSGICSDQRSESLAHSLGAPLYQLSDQESHSTRRDARIDGVDRLCKHAYA